MAARGGSSVEPLALTTVHLDHACAVLGHNLARWREAIRERVAQDLRSPIYDPTIDGPVLVDGVVFVGREYLVALVLALRDLVGESRGDRERGRVATALDPLRLAIARVAGHG